MEGIDVVGVGGAYSDYMRATGMGYGRRAAAFGRFAAGATAAALRAARPDVVFATSPPLTIALPAMAAARRHRAPLVFEVRDLWPRAPIEMGALRNPAARRAAEAMERRAYRAAAHVVALSPGMADGVAAAGVPRERITVIPNASDLDLFSPDVDPGDLRERLGLGDAFVAVLLRHDGRGQRPRPGGRGGHAAARPGRERRGVRAAGRGQAPRRASRRRSAAAA